MGVEGSRGIEWIELVGERAVREREYAGGRTWRKQEGELHAFLVTVVIVYPTPCMLH